MDGSHVDDSRDLVTVGFNATLGHHVPEEFTLRHAERVFLRIQFDVEPLEICERGAQAVCCVLDRIWSSTQRLEDLDWFGPEMPYVQYGVVFLLYCSRARVLKLQRRAYKLV